MKKKLVIVICLLGTLVFAGSCANSGKNPSGAAGVTLNPDGTVAEADSKEDVSANAADSASDSSASEYVEEAQKVLSGDVKEEATIDKAIDLYTKAAEEDPSCVDAYLGRAEAYLRKSENSDVFKAATADYQKAEELQPDLGSAYLGEAEVQIRDTNTEEAQAILTAALEKVTDETAKKQIQTRLDEISGDQYADSEGRIRFDTIYDSSSAVLEKIYYDRYVFLCADAAIIKTYDSAGTLTGTSFHLYEDTTDYVYGLIDASGVWSVYIPHFDEDGNMTGMETYLGDSLEGYEMYYKDSSGKEIGVQRYDADKNLLSTVIYDNPLAGNKDPIGVSGTAAYTVSDVHDLVNGIMN